MRLSHPEPLHSRHNRFPCPAQPLHFIASRFMITTPEPLQMAHLHPPIPPHILHGFSLDPRVKMKIVAPTAKPAAAMTFPITASSAKDETDIVARWPQCTRPRGELLWNSPKVVVASGSENSCIQFTSCCVLLALMVGFLRCICCPWSCIDMT